MYQIIISLFLSIVLSGCVILNRSIVHNATNSPIVVGMYQERRDLGWEAQRREEIHLEPNQACKLFYDVFYHTYIKIDDEKGVQLTRLGLFDEESVVYSYVEDSQGGYVVQHEPKKQIKKKLFDGEEKCAPIKEESSELLYFYGP